MKTNLYGEIEQVFKNGGTLTDTQSTQIKSVLKKLNQRMTEFEKHGLTNTAGYKNLVSLATALPNKINKAGNVRLIQSTTGINHNQVLRALAVAGNENTLTRNATAQGRAVARKMFDNFDKMSKAQQLQASKDVANELGDLHEFIVHHTDAYYWTANGGDINLESAVRRKSPDVKLHDDELAYMLRIKAQYEAGDEQLKQSIAEWNRNMW